MKENVNLKFSQDGERTFAWKTTTTNKTNNGKSWVVHTKRNTQKVSSNDWIDETSTLQTRQMQFILAQKEEEEE